MVEELWTAVRWRRDIVGRKVFGLGTGI